jgi:MFS family permease
MIQSVGAFGAVAGLLLINYLSDTRGMKYGIVVGQFVAIFGIGRKIVNDLVTILGGYTASVATLVVSQFFCGFAACSLIVIVYIMPAEYCNDHFRQNMIVALNYSW